jgi:hypothetical protein
VCEVGDQYDVPVRLSVDQSVEVPVVHRGGAGAGCSRGGCQRARHSGSSPSVSLSRKVASRSVTTGAAFDPAYRTKRRLSGSPACANVPRPSGRR